MSQPKIIKNINNRLKISGGTINGKITLDNGGNWEHIDMIDASDNTYRIRCGSPSAANAQMHITISEDNSNGNRTYFGIRRNLNDDHAILKNSIWLCNVIDGVETSYQIYGQHNKPTAADVGALALTGGTVNGNVIFTQDVKFKGNYGGPEGGQFTLVKPENNTSFNQDITVDIYGNLFRVFSVHNNILKVFNLDFTTAPEGHHTILHSANSVNYGSKYSFTIPEIYDDRTRCVDIKNFMDTYANTHKAAPSTYTGEFNLYRFFAAGDEANYATYNLPCVDSHVLTFSIDNNNQWTRLLALDMRSPNIYTITKNASSWGSWNMLYGTQNVTSGTGSASIAVEKGIYIRY